MYELLNNDDISKVSSPRFGDYIIINGAIMREKAYIEWIEDCIKKYLNKTIILFICSYFFALQLKLEHSFNRTTF